MVSGVFSLSYPVGLWYKSSLTYKRLFGKGGPVKTKNPWGIHILKLFKLIEILDKKDKVSKPGADTLVVLILFGLVSCAVAIDPNIIPFLREVLIICSVGKIITAICMFVLRGFSGKFATNELMLIAAGEIVNAMLIIFWVMTAFEGTLPDQPILKPNESPELAGVAQEMAVPL